MKPFPRGDSATVENQGRRSRARRLAFDPLEGRALMTGSPPFAVGGDPSVHPARYRVTTFALGLNYPVGMQALADGSLLVGVSNPKPAGVGTNFFDSTGQLLRFVDANRDGVADGPGSVMYDGLPGTMTAVRKAGPYILTTSSSGIITVLHAGASPADPYILAGTITLTFPSTNWEHTTYALAVRPTPGRPGEFDVFFNVGSEFNGIQRDAQGNILFDSDGHALPAPSVGTVTAGGLLDGSLNPDSVYMTTLRDAAGTPVFSSPVQVASGLRNAASLAIDPASGDLVIVDNGIDGLSNGDEAWSTDTLDRLAAADIGVSLANYGFPYHYTLDTAIPGGTGARVDLGPTAGVTAPLIAFQPLVDPNLPATGSESEGASALAIAPKSFPDGLDRGVFIGFHGISLTGGTANEENPLLYANSSTGKWFDFVSNDEPNIGHFDYAESTATSLFLSDISSTGALYGADGPGQGKIYEVAAATRPQVRPPGRPPGRVSLVGAASFSTTPLAFPLSIPTGTSSAAFATAPSSVRSAVGPARIQDVPRGPVIGWNVSKNLTVDITKFHARDHEEGPGRV